MRESLLWPENSTPPGVEPRTRNAPNICIAINGLSSASLVAMAQARIGKKVMRPPCGSTSGGRPVALCSALCHRWNPPVVQLLERAEHFLYLDGFSLDGSARRTPLPLSSVKTRRTESTSTSIPLLPIAPISLQMRSDSDT